MNSVNNKLVENEIKQTQDTNRALSSEQKRINSIIEMKKCYQKQKDAIKAALMRVDVSSNKKIFAQEETNSHNVKISDKKMLFSDEDDDEQKDSSAYNFSVKEYLTGQRGKKLMELQSKFKHDKRFIMGEKFLDDEDCNNGEGKSKINENDERYGVETTESKDMEITKEEKEKEMSILENILGAKIKQLKDKNVQNKKPFIMHCFDPLTSGNSNYISKSNEKVVNKKGKRKINQLDVPDKEQEEKKPYVSKQTFYDVKENLKETFQQNECFSFLNMFHSHNQDEKNVIADNSDKIDLEFNNLETVNHHFNKENPFRYDSSEESDNDEQFENNKGEKKIENKEGTSSATSKLWSEPLFFQEDDYRLQEGLDFVSKFELDDKSEFKQIRRNIKEIVRAKVKHNQQKNKLFKRKLGGKKLRTKKVHK